MSGKSATIMPEHQGKPASSELVSTLMQNDPRMAVNGINGLVGGGLDLDTLAVAINGIKENGTYTGSHEKCTCPKNGKFKHYLLAQNQSCTK